MNAFLQLFRQTATLLLSNQSTDPTVAQSMVLLLEIFYDFTCQDLPPAIEDAQAEFFGRDNGWFHNFMAWDPPHLKTDVSPVHS